MWETRKLRDLFDMKSGGTPAMSKPEFWGGDVPWVTCKDMNVDRVYDAEDHLTPLGARSGTREAEAGNILMVVRGMALARRLPLARVMRRVTFNQDLKCIIARPDTDATYLYYLLRSLEHTLIGAADEAAHGTKRIQTDRLSQIRVRVPPRDVQQQIAYALVSIDDLIDNNLRRIRVLEELASVLFARFSASAPRATVTQRPVADLIKQGLLEVNDGYRAKNDELNAPGLPFARAGNVNDGFQLDGADVLQESSVVRADRKVSRSGDIVFTSKGTVGRFAYVHASVPRFVYSPQLCFWRSLRPEQLSPRYLYRWMRSDAFTRQVDMVKGSTTMADYVSLGDQKRMKVDVPSVEDQRRLGEQLEPVEDSIANLTARNTTLRKLRDLLLPKLLSGEVDVSRLPLPPDEPEVAALPAPPEAPRRGRRTRA